LWFCLPLRVMPFLEMSWEPQVGQVISIAIGAMPLSTVNRSLFLCPLH
jgi:hypothetical protein